MAAVTKDARHLRVSAGGSPDAVWGVTGVMFKDILPEEPAERRRRRRLYALRALDRLGLLGEDNVISALARRPQLRWLADERGARWGVLAELGRIGDLEAFEEAVEWALESRPRPGEANAYVCRLRFGAERSCPSRATSKEEWRWRC